MIAIPSYELARIEEECTRAGVLNEYRAIIAKGTSPRAAAMYALQQSPGTNNTDQRFCAGQRKKMETMHPKIRADMQKIAKRSGIDTAGKYYMSAFGKYTDPAAWVTCAQDATDVCKLKNLHCEGTLKHKAVDIDPVPKTGPGLAPDIIKRFEQKHLAADPALAAKCKKDPKARRELREMVISNHGRRANHKRR